MRVCRLRTELILLGVCTSVLVSLVAICAVTYLVGVKPGDWAKYGDISAAWESTDPEAKMPPAFVEGGFNDWANITVLDVSGSNVRLGMAHQFKNGTETKDHAEGDLATGMGNLSFFLYPGGLSRGDSLPAGGTVNETITRSYAGARREINLLNFSGSFFGTNVTYHIYFDSITGILCEASTKGIIEQEGYITTVSSTIKMTDTNIWKRTEVAEFPRIVGLAIIPLVGYHIRRRRKPGAHRDIMKKFIDPV